MTKLPKTLAVIWLGVGAVYLLATRQGRRALLPFEAQQDRDPRPNERVARGMKAIAAPAPNVAGVTADQRGQPTLAHTKGAKGLDDPHSVPGQPPRALAEDEERGASPAAPAPQAALDGVVDDAMSPGPSDPDSRHGGVGWRAAVSRAAYFRAERRGFANGSPIQDWLEAEAELRQALRQDRAPPSR